MRTRDQFDRPQATNHRRQLSHKLRCPRDYQEFRVWPERFESVHAIARVKRSPNRMANWALASDHSRAGMVHSFSDRLKTRNVTVRRGPEGACVRGGQRSSRGFVSRWILI